MKTTVTKNDLSDLSSDDPKVKYRRARSLVAIARQNPAQLYPHLTTLTRLLRSENKIMKWAAIDIIGYVASIDKGGKTDRLLGRLCGLLHEGQLITANHAIGALTNFALANPGHQKRVTQALLGVERHTYGTKECHNIALGKAIQGMSLYANRLRPDTRVLAFVNRQTTNPRAATRKKAQKFLDVLGTRVKKGASHNEINTPDGSAHTDGSIR